ncbi:DUF397 domain-containing protein [Streptomyces sp. NPDC057910]|uniref:DUF397 domain-containing protein n=1 Tax=Streptomyces sp. NPDC057910 TaxID=3346278 RepID=UPI0036E95377
MSSEQVETGFTRLDWFKSSYSGSGGGDCVEVAITPAGVHVRDSKNVRGAELQVPFGEWQSFISFASGKDNLRP